MGISEVNGVEIEWNMIGDKDFPVILMTRGLGTQLIDWPPGFCGRLIGGRFRLILYDNRDVGLSQKFGECDVTRVRMNGNPAPEVGAEYDLFDMAADGIGLLDHLEIERAHVLGISMGGMISQIIAAKYPERVTSLVSIMSSAGEDDPVSGPEAAANALYEPWPPVAETEAAIEKGVRDTILFASKSHAPREEDVRTHVTKSVARSYCPRGILRQLAAIRQSTGRQELLAHIKCPALVVHGDEDPLIPASSGERAAQLMPHGHFHLVRGMGHDLPEPLIKEMADTIVAHCKVAEQGQ